MTEKQRTFLAALAREGRLSTSLANPPVMALVKAGLVRFVLRSEDLNIMEITDAGRNTIREGR